MVPFCAHTLTPHASDPKSSLDLLFDSIVRRIGLEPMEQGVQPFVGHVDGDAGKAMPSFRLEPLDVALVL